MAALPISKSKLTDGSVRRHKQLPPLSLAHPLFDAACSSPASLARWAALRLAVRSGLLQSSLQRARAKRASATYRTPGKKKTLLYVRDHSKLSSTPLWRQGNVTFYTPDQIEARYALRTAPEVKAALHEWWSAMLRSLQSGGDTDAATVSREQYIRLSKAIYRQLVPGRVTSCVYQADSLRNAEAEWARDSKGKSHLGRSDFLDALFELADHYTPTIDADDYAAFLLELLQNVSLDRSGAQLLWVEKPKPKSARPPTPSITASPKRVSAGRGQLHQSSSVFSLERQWLNKIEGLYEALPPSPSRSVLPSIGSPSSAMPAKQPWSDSLDLVLV